MRKVEIEDQELELPVLQHTRERKTTEWDSSVHVKIVASTTETRSDSTTNPTAF